MANNTRNAPNPQVKQIFSDLEKFLEFCVEYGYRFDQANLYNMTSFAYQQYTKFANGKQARNMWVEDARKFDQQF